MIESEHQEADDEHCPIQPLFSTISQNHPQKTIPKIDQALCIELI
jgi:hypothetical protein